jgi:hypothetical protein
LQEVEHQLGRVGLHLRIPAGAGIEQQRNPVVEAVEFAAAGGVQAG